MEEFRVPKKTSDSEVIYGRKKEKILFMLLLEEATHHMGWIWLETTHMSTKWSSWAIPQLVDHV